MPSFIIRLISCHSFIFSLWMGKIIKNCITYDQFNQFVIIHYHNAINNLQLNLNGYLNFIIFVI